MCTISISLGVYGREEKDSPCSQKFRVPTYALNITHSVHRLEGSHGYPRTVSCLCILSPTCFTAWSITVIIVLQQQLMTDTGVEWAG